MKRIKAWILILAALCLAVSAAWAEGESAGITLADFTAETADGGTFTLSEALKEKEIVIINLWASWCGPCAMEFPYLQEAYEQYRDRVEIIALSVEPGDTLKDIAAFAEARGLTFPMGNDSGIGLAETFQIMYIPTTVAVNREGTAVLTEVGAKTSKEAFTEMFDRLLEEYGSKAE